MTSYTTWTTAYTLRGTKAHTLIATLHLNLTWDPTNAAVHTACTHEPPQSSLHPQLLQARPSPEVTSREIVGGGGAGPKLRHTAKDTAEKRATKQRGKKKKTAASGFQSHPSSSPEIRRRNHHETTSLFDSANCASGDGGRGIDSNLNASAWPPLPADFGNREPFYLIPLGVPPHLERGFLFLPRNQST